MEPSPRDQSRPLLNDPGTGDTPPRPDTPPPASDGGPATTPETTPDTASPADTPSQDAAPAQAAAPTQTPAESPAPVPIASTDGHRRHHVRRMAAVTVLVLLLAAAASVAAMMLQDRSATAPATPDKLKVGVMMAFSGGSSSMGYGAMKGINLAKKQLDVKNIEIVEMDSKCDAKSAASAIRQLIAQDVDVIIGEGCSSASVAALPAANNAKVVMISPSASSPTLSIPDDYFFRVVPPDTLQGSFMAEHIYGKGSRNVAVFYTDEPYGSGMNQVFRESFEALGGKIVATASAEPDVIKLDAQVKAIKAANPQAIFIAPNSVVSATAAITLLREAGVTAPLYGADIMYDTTIIQNGGAATEGLTISSFPTGTKSFRQALSNENRKTEQLYAAPQAYDIIHVLQLAAEKGATTGEQIKQVLPEISFEGVSGPIAFDKNGEISNKDYRYDLFQVNGGEFVVVE